MKKNVQTLQEFLSDKSQSEAGKLLGGMTQSAIHQMIKSGREVYVTRDSASDQFDWYEIRRSPKSKQSA